MPSPSVAAARWMPSVSRAMARLPCTRNSRSARPADRISTTITSVRLRMMSKREDPLYMFRFRLVASLVCAIVCVALLHADFPKAEGYITDRAEVLNAGTFTQIETLIKETEQKTSAEIAVATVSSLDGMSVEEYANRL